MKVLVTTYHEAFMHKGGGEFEIITLVNNLQKFGVIADIYGPYCQNIENYDLVIHFSVHKGGLDLLKKVKSLNKKIILIPNFYTSDKNSIDFITVNSFLEIADIVVFNSNSIKNHFLNYFNLVDEKIKLADYMIDDIILKNVDKNIFKELYGIDDYILSFGIIEENKNQLKTIEMIKEFNKKLVLVGKYRDIEYYNKCKELYNNVIFIDSLAYHSDIMLSALAGCQFYIELSKEPAGLSAIEASLTGTSIIVTDMDWSREIFKKNVEFVDLNNDYDIKEKIKITIEKNGTKTNNDELKKHIVNNSINQFIKLLSETIGNYK